jgi:hypothetical protein
MDIEFTYWPHPPTLFEPGDRIADPAVYKTIVALTRGDLSASLGSDTAARAFPIAWDPAGKPAAWAVKP